MSKSADSSTKRSSWHGKAIKKNIEVAKRWLGRNSWTCRYIVSLCIFVQFLINFKHRERKKKKLSADYSNVLRKRAVHTAPYTQASGLPGWLLGKESQKGALASLGRHVLYSIYAVFLDLISRASCTIHQVSWPYGHMMVVDFLNRFSCSRAVAIRQHCYYIIRQFPLFMLQEERTFPSAKYQTLDFKDDVGVGVNT